MSEVPPGHPGPRPQAGAGDWPQRPAWLPPETPPAATPSDVDPLDTPAPEVPMVAPSSPFGGTNEDAPDAGTGPSWAPQPWSAPPPAAEALPVSTTGVPYYAPPAAVPELPEGGGFGPAEAAPPRRRSGLRLVGRGVRELAETVILALLIFLLVRAVVQNFQVEGRSMEPSFENGWYLLVNKALYWEINLNTVHKFIPFVHAGNDPTRYIFRGPRRGDVIVFVAPEQAPGQPERDFIKRIIGLPGESVAVHDCTVFINGKALDEPYILEKPNYTFGPETVPSGNLFVLGDNRNNSSDSHAWGMLPKENIIGQAWLIYWPFKHFGLVDNTSVKPHDVPAGTRTAKAPGVC